MNCHIVGYPLKNPRSVKLWKQYFKIKNIHMSMTKKSIPNNKIKQFIKYIKKDPSFYATAVTMPYKKLFYKITEKRDKITKYSKSVNLVIKKNNKLIGYNTDILALIYLLNKIKKKNILLIGMGGVGEAIYNVFKQKYKKSNISVISRKVGKTNKKRNFFKKLNKNILLKQNLIINCTPLGSNLTSHYKNKSILDEKHFSYLNKDVFIYDLVYAPKSTLLSKICKKNKIKYLNGLKMNTMQAEIALNLAFNKF